MGSLVLIVKKHLAAHAGLYILCVLFILATQLYAYHLGPFEGNDESEHFAYVLKLRQDQRLPDPVQDADTPIQQQVGQPPLYYIAAALFSLPVNVEGLTAARVVRNPWLGFHAPPDSSDNRNYALMNPRINALDADQVHLADALMWTRRVSLLLGLLGLAGAYWAGLALWPEQRQYAMLAAALMLFMPSVVQMYATVTNDGAVIAFGILVLASSMHLYHRWQDRRLLLAGGIFMGLAGLSKVSGLALYPIPVLAVFLGWWLNGDKSRSMRLLMRAWTVLVIPALLISGWWYLRGLILYGDPLGTAPHQAMAWGFSELRPIDDAIRRLPIIWQTLWFNAGWGEVRPPQWTQVFPAGALALGLLGWTIMLFSSRTKADARVFLLVLAMLVGLVALIRWMQMATLITGRLYLPYTFALVLLDVWGIRALFSTRTGPVLLAAVWVGVALTLIPSALINAFGPPVLLDQPPADLRGTPINFDLVRFIGYRIDDDLIVQGEPVHIELCWQAPAGTEPVPVPFPFALQIIAAENPDEIGPMGEPIIASRESFPGMGTYTLWQPGKSFCDRFFFRVTGPVEPGRIYPLYLTLFELDTLAGLPVFPDENGVWSNKIIGHVQGRP